MKILCKNKVSIHYYFQKGWAHTQIRMRSISRKQYVLNDHLNVSNVPCNIQGSFQTDSECLEITCYALQTCLIALNILKKMHCLEVILIDKSDLFKVAILFKQVTILSIQSGFFIRGAVYFREVAIVENMCFFKQALFILSMPYSYHSKHLSAH